MSSHHHHQHLHYHHHHHHHDITACPLPSHHHQHNYRNRKVRIILRVIISPVCSVVASSADMMFSVQEDKRAGQVCKTKNKKQLKEVEDAQLAAHR